MNNNISFSSNENNNKSIWIRTNFFISVCFLLLQVIIPGLILYLLTSKDFSFTYVIPLWLMFVLAIVLIMFTIISTIATYLLKWHQLDQFTYSIPFSCAIASLYISSFFLNNSNYFLLRFVIVFIAIVIGVTLTSIFLLLVIRRKSFNNNRNY